MPIEEILGLYFNQGISFGVIIGFVSGYLLAKIVK
jgi:uncharacterized membrane protein (Fun14 family)